MLPRPYGAAVGGRACGNLPEQRFQRLLRSLSRYISTAQAEAEIDLAATHAELVEIEKTIREATERHNRFLKELGLPELP